MEKQTILTQISERLNAIGVSPEKQTTADIVVDCEFLDAAWGAGKKKIEYHASAYIDETEGTLYFWEFTKDIGSGFSFGGESETSFQTGTTLFRKVKSVGYSVDGKAYDYSLDLGAITKSFKEVAKASGLNFKVVLKKDKASYPIGSFQGNKAAAPPLVEEAERPEPEATPIVPEPPSTAESTPATEETQTAPVSPQETPQQSYVRQQEIPQQSYVRQQEIPQPGNADQAKSNKPPLYSASKGKGLKPASGAMGTAGGGAIGAAAGMLWWVLFGALVLIYLVFFGFGGVSIIGWILGAALLAGVFFMKKKTAAKGVLASIITGVVAFVILALIFTFTIQDTKGTDGIGSTDQNPPPAASSEQQEQPAFYMGNFSRFLMPSYAYDTFSGDATASVALFGQINMAINANPMYPPGNLSNKVSRIYLTNFQIIKPPKIGEAGFYIFGDSFSSTDADREARKMPQTFEIAVDQSYDEAKSGENRYINDFGSGQIALMFGVYNLGILTSDDINNNTLAPITKQNLTSDDLRSTIGFDVVVETTDGQKFVNHVKTDLIDGEFLTGAGQATRVEDQFGTDATKMPFSKE